MRKIEHSGECKAVNAGAPFEMTDTSHLCHARCPVLTRGKVIDDILAEREKQVAMAHGGDTEAFDKSNSQNDWIAYVNAYIGRAAQKVFRNERESQTFRENMVKAAALCVAAIEAHDKGYC